MRWLEDTPYNETFLSELDKDSFSLTYDMCSKNQYTGNITVRKLINQEISHPIAIILYEVTAPKKIHIYSFEVHKNYRLQDYGRLLMSKFKEIYNEIVLNSLPETKLFYEKLDFVEQEENQMIWRKPNGT